MPFPDRLRTLTTDFDPDTISTHPFWDDEHISAQMLKAHLDPSHDAASRRPELRQATLDWLGRKILTRKQGAMDIVDLGCGPGLYATELAKAGHRVTGSDLSPRSLAYAREQAQNAGLPIVYRNESYLALEDQAAFDLAIMILCDMGALTKNQRAEVLRRIRRALKPGGTVLFDVWGPDFPSSQTPGRNWSWQESGFWSPRPHLLLEESRAYPGVIARRTIVWEEEGDEPKVMHLRDYWFDEPGLTALLEEAGFRSVKVHHGVLGAPGTSEGRVLFVSARA